jgi:hypothetical protein
LHFFGIVSVFIHSTVLTLFVFMQPLQNDVGELYNLLEFLGLRSKLIGLPEDVDPAALTKEHV